MTQGHLFLTIACFMLAYVGFKAYMPRSVLANLFLVQAAAAGSIGRLTRLEIWRLPRSSVLGKVQTLTGSFVGGIYFLAVSMTVSATIIFLLRLERKR
jgi:ACS family tartrate transporter-like MFS transporter